MSQSLEGFLERERHNAALCWALTAVVLLIVGYCLYAGDYVGAALGVAVVAAILGPPLALRSPWVTLPWEVLFAAAAALVVREVVPWQTGEFVGNYVVIAAIALVLAVEVHVYTRVEMSDGFATAFVAMVTMAAATAWTLGRWAVDLTAGTQFVADNDALMGELITAAVVGIAAGMVFVGYFRRYPPEAARPEGYRPPDESTPGDGESPDERERRNPTLSDRLGVSEHRQRWIVRGMQLGLVGLVLFGVLLADVAVALTGAGALVVTLLPALLRREYDVPMDVGLTLWISTAVFLHSLGTSLFYGEYFWWHNLTHAVSGSLIAGIGYATFRAVDEYTTIVRFPSRFMFVLILLFVVSVGVLWEIGEFLSDELVRALGSDEPVFAQYGLADTMSDMLFNVLGALVVATWGTAYLTGVAASVRNRLDGES